MKKIKKVIISPFSSEPGDQKLNPKNYHYWEDIVIGLRDRGFHTIQIGTEKDAPLGCNEFIVDKTIGEVEKLIKECEFWMSIDSFLPHMANCVKVRGIVIFTVSDPHIYGYKQNVNLLKSRKYLRKLQFDVWANCENEVGCCISPDEVLKAVDNFHSIQV